MKKTMLVLGALLSGFLIAVAQSGVVIESFTRPGQITFSKLTNSARYDVESSRLPNGAWTSVWSSASSGPGTLSASVSLSMTSGFFRVSATATNDGGGDAPPGMVLIPAGSFVMGATTNVGHESNAWELPQHAVYVSAFHMDVYEVTKSLWDAVTNHNGGNGYSYTGAGSGKAANHPVIDVNWFDMFKWCNARSQRDGLTPVYYADAPFATVYKTGEIAPYANWAADGYRLPTEAEWEKAARGGVANHRFPWSDSDEIQHSRANYYSTNSYAYDTSATRGCHPTYATGEYTYTSPVGSFAPNGYGLYDMAGNAVEGCWDWYEQDYYVSSPGSDPRGPDSSSTGWRVGRGGSWGHLAEDVRVAGRLADPPTVQGIVFGFRCARGLGVSASAEIAVLGTNLAEVASGDSSPSTADGTDFGSVDVTAGTVTRTFFITNSGSAVLTISGVATSGTHAADFAVLSFPASVGPGGRSNLTVRFDPSATGLRSATLTVSNSDTDESSYAFAVQGTGTGDTPSGMVLVPAGSFMMGNATNVFPASEGMAHELPQHTVYVSAFYMEKYEVTKACWDEVAGWAAVSGYDIAPGNGAGKAANHPAQMVSWYECVKWCNARSEQDGLTPCYTTNDVPYRTGNNSNVVCNWSANGYRLPTEAEWEKAARGGVANRRFPWSDSDEIQHVRANYISQAEYAYDISPTRGYHPAFSNAPTPYSGPVGSFAPNGYGLYDMAGNIYEWCWDASDSWTNSTYYSISPPADPKGPSTGSYRALRGGSWNDTTFQSRLADRRFVIPVDEINSHGFRCARGKIEVPAPEIAVLGTNLAEIASGDNTPSTADGTHFGSVSVPGGTATRTFFITNSGPVALTISGVTTSGTHAADFSVLAFPASVTPGGVSNLVIRFAPSSFTVRSATITVLNNDSDEGSYGFAIQGSGYLPF